MKSFAVAMAMLAATGMVSAAGVSASDCAQMCISNMKAKASELGCTSGDLDCLCKSQDYSYGIRDCTKQACPDDDASTVLSMALESCPSTQFYLLKSIDHVANNKSAGSSTGSSTGSGSGATTGSGKSSTGTMTGTMTGSSTTAYTTITTSVSGELTTETKPISTGTKTGNAAESTTITTSVSGTLTTETKAVTDSITTGSTMITTTVSGTLTTETSAVTGTETSTGSGSGSGSESTSGSDSAPSTSSGAAHPMATVGTGAFGVLGLAAMMVL
ncbi:uncharacterized protein N7484_000876 [Penicillium longicatenatum]|uniref:uncharacterized protein n=1 Tax=Penicillium longicatenatum TaxID=1561947 RepID=UPI002546CF79|nr:uncharacterized protein N7484_000876 [Penicillium longicatenatum]KAJ5657227.1 hypothetical protein N7484_000876 [Penicillium longicatenatum]